jgi:hypothetical protein
MLTIRTSDPAHAVALLGTSPPAEGIEQEFWDPWSRVGTLRAFVAEEAGRGVGLALADFHPRLVQVFTLEGTTDACGLLLERLVRAAGERDVSVWCPAARIDVRELLEQKGFARQVQGDFLGRPSYLFSRGRNQE